MAEAPAKEGKRKHTPHSQLFADLEGEYHRIPVLERNLIKSLRKQHEAGVALSGRAISMLKAKRDNLMNSAARQRKGVGHGKPPVADEPATGQNTVDVFRPTLTTEGGDDAAGGEES